MSLLKEWQQLVQASLNVEQFQFKKKYGDIEREALYLSENSSKMIFPGFQQGQQFINAVPFDYLPEGSQAQQNTAIYCDPLECSKTYSKSPIFFKPRARIETELFDEVCASKNKVDLGLDPVSLSLWKGQLSRSPDLSEGMKRVCDNVKLFRPSTLAYQMAGASEGQQLAILLASLLQMVRDYEGPFGTEKVLQKTSIEISLSTQTFLNISKLQALRLLICRLQELLGVKLSEPIPIYGVSSPRHLASREPWNNLLRMSSMIFSAKLGGAQGFFHLPYDLYGKDSVQGGRLSRNISMIMEVESMLGQVQLPAAGSGLMDTMTDHLCQKSWLFFQEIEAKGGLLASLQSGWLQTQIQVEHEKELKSFRNSQYQMIGVNAFAPLVSLSEAFPLQEKEQVVDALGWWLNHTGDSHVEGNSDVQPLKPFQLSSYFECWQWAADNYRKENQKNIAVSVINLEGVKQKTKVSWLRNQLATGGVDTIETSSGSKDIYPICFFVGSDPENEELQVKLGLMKEKGVRFIFWVGDRSQKNFDDFFCKDTEVDAVFNKIFEIYGVSL